MSAALVEAVQQGWGWTGIEPEAVTATSPFGHAIVRDTAGAYWYLDVELRTLTQVATDEAGMLAHMNDPDVRAIWEARQPVERARQLIGEPGLGRCYSRSIASLIEGNFAKDDYWHPPIAELISVMGDIEQQLHDVPDGTMVHITTDPK